MAFNTACKTGKLTSLLDLLYMKRGVSNEYEPEMKKCALKISAVSNISEISPDSDDKCTA